MGILIKVLLGIFPSIAGFIAMFITKKFSITATFGVLFIGLTVAFIAAVNSLIAVLYMAMPTEMTLAIQWFMPSNLPLCISTYYAAVALRFVYDLKFKIIKSWA